MNADSIVGKGNPDAADCQILRMRRFASADSNTAACVDGLITDLIGGNFTKSQSEWSG